MWVEPPSRQDQGGKFYINWSKQMSEKRYFKERYYSTDYGEEGMGYWEYIDGFCTRHIVALKDRIVLYRQEIGHYNINMPDHRLSENDFKTSGSEISQSEFESVWAKGVEIPDTD